MTRRFEDSSDEWLAPFCFGDELEQVGVPPL